MHARSPLMWPILVVALLHGCNDATPSPAPELSSAFDPATGGTIEGQVLWEGPIPAVTPFTIKTNRFEGKEALQGLVRDNPNAPVVDSKSQGVDQAVVFLRGIDPTRARPWDHQPVRIEMRDLGLHIVQGTDPVRIGFVRRGDEITMISNDHVFHALRAVGAAFFTFTFVDREKPSGRRLDRQGLVELSSGAGYYWLRGYLFVDQHPYYARTDKQGRFRLGGVPPGRYQLVCWLPNWHVARQERNPESSLISRIFLAPPLEQEKQVVVSEQGSCTVNFTVPAAAFAK